jgi:DeoR/GlpR family transcriptional regulator of sugar metabolism
MGMNQKLRHSQLLEILYEFGRVEVNDLAARLDVSQVTIRKDLGELERRGLLKREHGYAVETQSDDIANRLAFHYQVKQRIARAAASFVENGETVMIESGSCCALLAQELATTKKDITIITNSAFTARYAGHYAGIRLVLLGGEYQQVSQAVVGPLTRSCVQNFFVDKLFVGTDGFSMEAGFTGGNLMRCEAIRDMAGRANRVILMTESRKFHQKGVVGEFRPEEVSVLVTDRGIPEELVSYFNQKKVEIIIVEEG